MTAEALFALYSEILTSTTVGAAVPSIELLSDFFATGRLLDDGILRWSLLPLLTLDASLCKTDENAPKAADTAAAGNGTAAAAAAAAAAAGINVLNAVAADVFVSAGCLGRSISVSVLRAGTPTLWSRQPPQGGVRY